MINITDLNFDAPSTAPPGTLLIQSAMSPRYAAWLSIGGGGPRNALTIDNGAHGFNVVNSLGAHGQFLSVARPRFVVDPLSALSGFDSSPERGRSSSRPPALGSSPARIIPRSG